MTFLCTRGGRLVDGGASPWPQPWGFRCNGCGRVLPYGCVIRPDERRTSFDQARHTFGDIHLCGACDGTGYAGEQLALFARGPVAPSTLGSTDG